MIKSQKSNVKSQNFKLKFKGDKKREIATGIGFCQPRNDIRVY
jgi:hypothetical protein